MTHFICKGGCKGVSKTEGNCQAKDCKDFGHPLEQCSCEDGQHGIEE